MSFPTPVCIMDPPEHQEDRDGSMEAMCKALQEATIESLAKHCTGKKSAKKLIADSNSHDTNTTQDMTGSGPGTSDLEDDSPAYESVATQMPTLQQVLGDLSCYSNTAHQQAETAINQTATGPYNSSGGGATPANLFLSTGTLQPQDNTMSNLYSPAAPGELTTGASSLMPAASMKPGHIPVFASFKEEVEARRRWGRIWDMMRQLRFDKSPYVPRTFDEYVEHMVAIGAWPSVQEEQEEQGGPPHGAMKSGYADEYATFGYLTEYDDEEPYAHNHAAAPTAAAAGMDEFNYYQPGNISDNVGYGWNTAAAPEVNAPNDFGSPMPNQPGISIDNESDDWYYEMETQSDFDSGTMSVSEYRPSYRPSSEPDMRSMAQGDERYWYVIPDPPSGVDYYGWPNLHVAPAAAVPSENVFNDPGYFMPNSFIDDHDWPSNFSDSFFTEEEFHESIDDEEDGSAASPEANDLDDSNVSTADENLPPQPSLLYYPNFWAVASYPMWGVVMDNWPSVEVLQRTSRFTMLLRGDAFPVPVCPETGEMLPHDIGNHYYFDHVDDDEDPMAPAPEVELDGVTQALHDFIEGL